MRILLAEDDIETGDAARRSLEAAGHQVELVRDGGAASKRPIQSPFDLAVLDRRLPGRDGLAVLRGWRAGGMDRPVILLTALCAIADRVEGLDAGADDYLTKPFATAELVARVAALGRRRIDDQRRTTLRVGDIVVDLVRREVGRAGRRVRLQPHEFKLLEQLMRNAGRVVTRTMLLKEVWDYDFDPGTNIVESHLSRMRAKLNEGGARDPVETLRGAGYRMRADG